MRPTRAAAGIGVVAVCAVAFFAFLRGESEPDDDFRPYDPPAEAGGPTAEIEPSSAPPRGSTEPPRPPPDAPAAQAPEPEPSPEEPHDIMNRTGPGPDGFEEEAPTAPGPRGHVAKEHVREAISEVKPLLKACYEETLKDFPDARGRVTLSFRVIAEDDEGRVELSEVDEENTSLFDNRLHDCLSETIAEAKFPAPGGGGTVSVTYPFNFATDAEPEPGEE